MTLNIAQTRQTLRNFDFKTLFIELLGWDRHSESLEITVDGKKFFLHAVAQKRGVVAFLCKTSTNGGSPDYQMRRRIETIVDKSHHEHIIVFVDEKAENQIWQWVKREIGKPLATREHVYHSSQSGDALIQKLQNLAFNIEEEENLTLVNVTSVLRAGFDVEPVVKRFYKDFETEHETFLNFIKGISEEGMQRWYASVMLDRLMFIYFLQSKNFLDNDARYLQNRLRQHHGKDRYYQDFLCHLFFEGFAVREQKRSVSTKKQLGKVPYLNGGLFLRHKIEEENKNRIQIADAAFFKLFGFFDKWDWRLDNRPLRNDREINPDVLGYIFEKLINQKQMGAYYTKEDITEYIGKNTIIPFLFDAVEKKCPDAFAEASQNKGSIWSLLRDNPDRYIYEAVKKGVRQPLPNNIAAGIAEVPKRGDWNKRAAEEFALPTEIWREVVARRQRYEELHTKMRRGEIHSINDFITCNLNIRQFAQDVIANCDNPELLRAIYHTIEKLTVLDPTCGSGAFLFAALNILEPLYEACLDRMEAFLHDGEVRLGLKESEHQPKHSVSKSDFADPFNDFRQILARVAEHSNRRYFILKAIIVNNLFGVDIMEEAVEICKLRLFLKLAAQAEKDDSKPNLGIEPLPDIDFNIRAGNTLVGFATRQEVKDWITVEASLRDVSTDQYKMRQLLSGDALERIEMKAQAVDDLFASFRQQQTEDSTNATPIEKEKLQKKLGELRKELNRYLAAEYVVSYDQSSAYDKWLESHKPFHWFVEFYGVMKNGGFDVIIGNPPYVEYSKKDKLTGQSVRDQYQLLHTATLSCGNLYPFMIERSLKMQKHESRFGMIIPVSSISNDSYQTLARLVFNEGYHVSSYSNRPGKLFKGVEQRLVILLKNSCQKIGYTSRYMHWYEKERPFMISSLSYVQAKLILNRKMPYKAGNHFHCSILTKLSVHHESIRKYEGPGKYFTYYHDGPTYWIRALPFEPSQNTSSGRSNHYHRITSTTACDAMVVCAILNSSLFYLHFKSISNCRDLGDFELYSFPVARIEAAALEEICLLSRQLGNVLDETAKLCKREYPSGTVRYKEYYPANAKSIIDEVDQVLAQYYGFTDKELDFIINYDIKYRMCNAAEEE